MIKTEPFSKNMQLSEKLRKEVNLAYVYGQREADLCYREVSSLMSHKVVKRASHQ